MGRVLNVAGDPACESHGLGAVVGHAEGGEHFGQAHEPQPDLAARPGRLFEFVERIAADVDDVVEEPHRHLDDVGQAVPVHTPVGGAVGEVDRAEVAGFVGQQRHLPARVGRFDAPQVGKRVGAVDGVQEQQTGIAASMRGLAHGVEEVRCRHSGRRSPGARIDQPVRAVGLDSTKESIADRDGEVEVLQCCRVCRLGGDEFVDIRMGDVKNGHIGASPAAALAHHVRSSVEDPQKRHRAARGTAGTGHEVTGRTHSGERIPGSATGLLNDRGVLQGGKDRPQRVLHGQHHTAGQEPEGRARVHQRRRVRQEVQAAQQRGKPLRPLLRRPGLVGVLGRRDERRHPIQHLSRRFHRMTMRVAAEVALPQYGHRGQAELQLIAHP